MPAIKILKGATTPNDSMAVSPSNHISLGTFITLADGHGFKSIHLTYEQVKILRKVLKKCMKTKGE